MLFCHLWGFQAPKEPYEFPCSLPCLFPCWLDQCPPSVSNLTCLHPLLLHETNKPITSSHRHQGPPHPLVSTKPASMPLWSTLFLSASLVWPCLVCGIIFPGRLWVYVTNKLLLITSVQHNVSCVQLPCAIEGVGYSSSTNMVNNDDRTECTWEPPAPAMGKSSLRKDLGKAPQSSLKLIPSTSQINLLFTLSLSHLSIALGSLSTKEILPYVHCVAAGLPPTGNESIFPAGCDFSLLDGLLAPSDQAAAIAESSMRLLSCPLVEVISFWKPGPLNMYSMKLQGPEHKFQVSQREPWRTWCHLYFPFLTPNEDTAVSYNSHWFRLSMLPWKTAPVVNLKWLQIFLLLVPLRCHWEGKSISSPPESGPGLWLLWLVVCYRSDTTWLSRLGHKKPCS